jgi:hypothetical protein
MPAGIHMSACPVGRRMQVVPASDRIRIPACTIQDPFALWKLCLYRPSCRKIAATPMGKAFPPGSVTIGCSRLFRGIPPCRPPCSELNPLSVSEKPGHNPPYDAGVPCGFSERLRFILLQPRVHCPLGRYPRDLIFMEPMSQ